VRAGTGGKVIMKSGLRFSKASGTTRRRIENIVRRGERITRRHFIAVKRRELKEGGTAYAC
jgi:hypothetical protein